jgi:phosphatidylglycerophosphate synthase
MGLLADYRASLKPLDVEEPIDVYVHRPIGFVIARLAMPTPITPNQITVLSMVLGLCAGLAMAARFPHHEVVAGLCLLLSAGLDCADGMLARMRRSFSEIGRMLDGVADLVSLVFALTGVIWFMCVRWAGEPRLLAAILVGSAITIQSSRVHTLAYDHYKNLFARMTIAGSKDGDDVRAARASFEKARAEGSLGLVKRVAYAVYFDYLDSGRRFFARFDPSTTIYYDALPAWSPENAAVYRKHCLRPMRLQGALFGVGSLMFGLEIAFATGLPEAYLLFRLLVINGIFWLVLRPMQRRASAEAFREIGFDPAAALEAARAA